MKKLIVLILAACFLLGGCSNLAGESDVKPQEQANAEMLQETEAGSDAAENSEASGSEEQSAPVAVIYPLPDTTMDSINDAILSVSLEEDGVYVDGTGAMLMDVKIYSYDIYDMVDVSMLKEGDILATSAGEVEVISLERMSDGTLSINGGLDAGGFELVTDGYGVYYECGFNDAKSWYVVGEASLRVSEDFVCYDDSDPEQRGLIYYAESFLAGEVADCYFFPSNTSIRTENGMIVEMNRIYIP